MGFLICLPIQSLSHTLHRHSRLQEVASCLLALVPWLLDPGSWLLPPGYWLLAPGSWLPPGSPVLTEALSPAKHPALSIGAAPQLFMLSSRPRPGLLQAFDIPSLGKNPNKLLEVTDLS